MFQIDEKSLADGRSLISIQPEKSNINRLLKSGTINFTSKDSKLWLTTPAIRQAFVTKQGNIDDLYDRILTAVNGTSIHDSYEFRDDQKFLSNVDIGKDVVIRGNLAVLGDSTTVDTPSMTIEDNIIELNKNEKNQGITLKNAGTAINRGTKGYARYLYSEDFGGFVLNNSTAIDGPIQDWTLIALTEDNGSYLKGDVRINNRLYSPFAKITDSIVIDQKTTTKDLEVTNASIFGGETTFNDNVTINGVLTTNGQVDFRNTVTAYKPVTFQDVAVFNNNVTMNKLLTNNDLVTMNKGLNVHSSNVLVDTGTLQVGGNVTFDSSLGVTGNTTINGALSVNNIITSTNTITGNDFLTQSHYFISGGDGHGIRFWDKSDQYTIFMSGTEAAGHVENAESSDYNMYFKMTGGTNRGFVFQNGDTKTIQFEGSGIIRSINDIYSKNSRVLTQADEGEGHELDADTVDGKHARDLLWRDGSLEMLGDLQMGTHKVKFANDDYIAYEDTDFNLNSVHRFGKFYFSADKDMSKTVVETGAFKAGNLVLDSVDNKITGVDKLIGTIGTAFKFSDSWLRINPDNDFTTGVYLNQSLLRTDNEMQIGENGITLKANSSIFTYKGQKVLTQAGIDTMNGDINMSKYKIHFNAGVDTGTSGAGATDFASIYAEHNENTEISRLILDVGDGAEDTIVMRTHVDNATTKDSIIIKTDKTIFSDNPYFNENRLLHTGDMGPGKGIDADTVDGKHYNDLKTEFVDATGDSMTGNLTMDNGSYIIGGISGQKVPIWAFKGYEKFGLFYTEGNPDIFSINLTGLTGETFKLVGDGTGFINNSKILTEAMEGHSKGIDADTVDGQHLQDLDNRFVNTAGDTMTGHLNMAAGCCFVGSYQYGYMAKTKGNTSDYVLYIDSNDSVHVGYNNRQIYFDCDNPTVKGYHKIWHEGNDGHTSGLDADTIDGQQLTDLDNRFVNTLGDTMTGALKIETTSLTPLTIKCTNGGTYLDIRNNTDTRSGWIGYGNTNDTNLTINNESNGDVNLVTRNNFKAKVNGNEIVDKSMYGHTKGIDADTVDGKHSSDFATADHNHDDRYISKNEVDLKNKYRIAYDESTNSLNFMYLG